MAGDGGREASLSTPPHRHAKMSMLEIAYDHDCQTVVRKQKLQWLNGRASVFGTEGCGFESRLE